MCNCAYNCSEWSTSVLIFLINQCYELLANVTIICQLVLHFMSQLMILLRGSSPKMKEMKVSK